MQKILIIEDEIAYQKILKDTFEREKFKVILCGDVASGLSLTNQNKPDLILLDIMLPGGQNGFDFLEKIKSEESTRRIPVIIITNLSSEEKVSKEIGAAFYFIKSQTTIEEIVAKVKELLS